MLTFLLAAAVVLAVSYAVADKSKIPEYDKAITRAVRPWAILLGIIALIFLFAP